MATLRTGVISVKLAKQEGWDDARVAKFGDLTSHFSNPTSLRNKRDVNNDAFGGLHACSRQVVFFTDSLHNVSLSQ